MKKENIVNKDRVCLQKEVPLTQPLSMSIDVCSLCNFRCKFCACQSEKARLLPHQLMSWSLYKKVIDDIASFPKPLKKLEVYGLGEPLINPELPKMIAYAKQKNVAEFYQITTNGSLLTHKLSDQLVEAGLDRILISVEGISADTYKKLCSVDICWNDFVNNIEYLYQHRKQCEIVVKTFHESVPSLDEQKAFYSIFSDKCDKAYIDHIIPNWAEFDEIYQSFDINRTEGIHDQPIEKIQICAWPFYQCLITPTGEMQVCCADWRGNLTMGNVTEKSILNIWNGEKYRKFLMDMLKLGREKCCSTCAHCEYPDFDVHDRLDDYRTEILERFQKVNPVNQ